MTPVVPRPRGFTLIELMVAIALIAIMLSLAAPSFVKFQRNSELTVTANAFIGSIATTRAEAMKRNRSAYMMPGSPSTSSGAWTDGWFVFVDVNSNGSYDAGTDLLVAEEPAPSPRISTPATTGVNKFSAQIRFNGSGFPRDASNNVMVSSAVDFSYDPTDVNATRRIILSPAGRARVCKPDATTCVP